MNTAKKLLIAFLALCMFVPTGAFGASGELYVPDCTHETQVLAALGVMEDVNTLNLSQEVSRGLAAHYLTNLMNIPSGGIKGKFADVTADTPYCAQIEALTDVGVINGTGSGLFEPNRAILLQEFVKMLVSAIGYGLPADAQGGYPYGYIHYASSLDILDGIEQLSVNESFSLGTMAVMLYNCLDAEILTVDGYGNEDSVSLGTVKGSTVLTNFLHCYTAEGQVKSTDKGSLTSSEPQADGMALIGEEVYRTGSVDINPYLGYMVDVYYKIDSNRKTIVYASPSQENSVLVLDAEDIDAYSDMTLTYYDDKGDTDTVRFSSDTDVVYNWRPVAPVIESDLSIDNGTVTVIDCDGTGGADAVIVKSYRTVYARQIDYHNKIIYDEYNTASPLKLRGDIDLVIYDRKGNEATVDSLEADSLLVCVVSRDGGFVEITEVVDEIIGKVESIEKSNSETFVVIGGKSYGICKELERYGLNFGVGDKIICYLDLRGNIGMVRDDMVTREKWGYLEAVNTTSGLDSYAMVRIMEEGGSALAVFNCADKLRINSGYYSTASTQKTALSANTGSVVRYALNADGEVAVIKTAGNGFVEAYAYPGGTDKGLWWDSSISVFGGKIGASSDTTVFLIPDNGDAAKYVCTTVSKACSHYKYYKLSAYKLSEEQLIADVVTFEVASTRGSSVGDSSPVMMVDAIRVAADEDGELRKQIAGYVDGNAAAYFVEDDSLIESVPAFDGSSATGSYAIRRGDLIQFQLDSGNVMVDSRILCRASDNMSIFGRAPTPTNGYNDDNRVMKGWVYQTDGSFFTVSPAKPDENTVLTEPEIYPVISSIGVYVYYPSSNTVKVGSMSDFLSYKAVGSGCSEVVAFMTGSDMMAVVLKGE